MKELEIHDIGASVKRHRRTYLRPWRSWAPYPELEAAELEDLVARAGLAGYHLVMCVTACWVEDDGRQVPYPKKFPAAARTLRDLDVTIACHGLTHCQVGQHHARLLRSNRAAWREFLPTMPALVERHHLRQSKKILEDWWGRPVHRLVPPGDVFTARTSMIAKEEGYTEISCRPGVVPELCVLPTVSPRRVHDRDVVRGYVFPAA